MSPFWNKDPLNKKPRKWLFRQSKKSEKSRLPITLILLVAGIFLCWLIPTDLMVNEVIAPQDITAPVVTALPTLTPLPRPTAEHGGQIIFTCQRGDYNQICMVNADGSDLQQLTHTPTNHYYPTFAPQGNAIVFAAYQTGDFELFMYVFTNNKTFQLTEGIGNAFSPDFSPDGETILFANQAADSPPSLWTMGLLGENQQMLYAGANTIVGAAWSPDGKTIAFAMEVDVPGSYEIFTINIYALDQPPRRLTHGLQGIGGSLDWSPDGSDLLIYAGAEGEKEIYRLDVESGEATQLTYSGNNASASYSPDGQWIVFNSLRNDGQADLYLMLADGHSMRQLTSHPEPDWQPQWKP